ncbi:E3 ubiquitin-protein ligase ZNRF1 [Teleopsis dalmanni]|uniref:E3 ubiquitin-protein ligase ZNRF1 n=1 Tax=Teleopsis dalmanni TaxID=139649 RepID=UPI000D32BE4D|nr:E3 ubiquitin-protein ligase ZNRF1 [Teleopsis dalmanni]XP_037938803.1 E3 ubiquitin-protein ligase ZNRF1 [Teleopsis dalmanni]
MGAKSSTPAGHQSPRSRTFSSSSADTPPSPTADLNVPGEESAQGFNLLRTLPGLHMQHVQSAVDRQRARSLSSVPDIHQQSTSHTHPALATTTPSGNNFGVVVNNNLSQNHTTYLRHPQGDSFRLNVPVSRGAGNHQLALNFEDLQEVSRTGANFVESIALAAGSENGIGRVYTATSLPSHIWSFNGIKCPVCNKFVLPDDIECHLVMCLTKPRLSYNEDILSDAKGECVICLEDLNPGDVIARLPCLCIYHKGCIDRWFEVNRSCPEHPGD